MTPPAIAQFRAVATPALLLLAGVVHNNAHKWVPAALSGRVYLITGAALIVLLLLTVGLLARQPLLWPVIALLAGYALQAIGCNVWYVLAPWPVQPGGELCSDRMQVPIGTLGLWAAAMLAQNLYLRGPGHGQR